ncbi:MAG: glutamate ligase domain-containing protein, partial [Tenacibaculum sp.]
YKNLIIQSNLIGKYNYNNIAAAITIGEYFKVETSLIKEAIEKYIPTNNRSQIIEKNTNKIILDAYNANPTSVKAALENFHLLNEGNKIVILGDMFELGKDSKTEHQSISNLCDSLNFKSVYLVGENFHNVSSKNKTFSSFNDLKNHLIIQEINNSVILIKGSRGMALERLVELF